MTQSSGYFQGGNLVDYSTDPLPLNTNATTDSLLDEYPRISTDRRGNWIAVWTRS